METATDASRSTGETELSTSGYRRWLRAAAYLPVFFFCIGLVCAFWKSPGILTLILSLVSFVLLRVWNTRSDIVCFTAAFVLGPIGEFIAIASGAWSYSAPWVKVPIWLPLAWGIAALYLKRTTEVLVSPDSPPRPSSRFRQSVAEAGDAGATRALPDQARSEQQN